VKGQTAQLGHQAAAEKAECSCGVFFASGGLSSLRKQQIRRLLRAQQQEQQEQQQNQHRIFNTGGLA
jgi:hypothetical protein